MKLRFYEEYGSFNWCDSFEKSTRWTLTIVDEENKPIKVEGGFCKLHWEEDGDHTGMYSVSDGINELANMSLRYADKVMSSVDYKQHTINFIKTYNENKLVLSANYETTRKKEIQQEIKHLEKQLDCTKLDGDSIDVNFYIDSKVESKEKYIERLIQDQCDYKENSDKYNQSNVSIEKAIQEITNLQALRYE